MLDVGYLILVAGNDIRLKTNLEFGLLIKGAEQ